MHYTNIEALQELAERWGVVTDEELKDLVKLYKSAGGHVIAIWGTLRCNFIMYGEGLKTFIVRERFYSEFVSVNKIFVSDEIPEEYTKVVEFWKNGEKKKARNLFFAESTTDIRYNYNYYALH